MKVGVYFIKEIL